LAKSVRFFAVVFRAQHARHNRHFGARGDQLAHQFTGKGAIGTRLHTNNAGALAFRRIRRDADAPFFRIVNQWLQVSWTTRCENDSIHAESHELLKRFRVSFSERLNGTVHELNTQMRGALGFIQDATPELVVEEMNLPGHANADLDFGFGDRQGACRKVRCIAELARNLEDALTGGFLDSRTPVKSSIHGPDGHLSEVCDQVNTASFLGHGWLLQLFLWHG